LERVKAMPRSAAAADAESYRPELAGEDEPRYLRRQKPVEIRRKKFSGKTWSFYRRLIVVSGIAVVVIISLMVAGRFLWYSPQMLLVKPDQIDLTGNHIVSREAVLKEFKEDRGLTVLRIPLDSRRSKLEQLPWVESASVQRVLPNRLRIEITERAPVAFVRNGNELALIDAYGVILSRPDNEEFHFPIVSGVSDDLPREQREKRMQTFQEFMKDIDLVGFPSDRDKKNALATHPSEKVSEVELGNPKDLRVVMTGLSTVDDAQAVTIHFGQNDFTNKFSMLVGNFAQWQANTGRVQSIDLQYPRQVVVNPDTSAGTITAKNK
jgi:cell division protein FtsQ